MLATPEDKYRLLLQVAEAANSALDLSGVLEEVDAVLAPLVSLDAAGIVTADGDRLRLHSIHIRGFEPKTGESFDRRVARALDLSPSEYEARYGRPIALHGSGTALVGSTGRADVCQDLGTTRRFPEDDRLLSYGVHAYVRTPLVFRDRLVGSITFARLTPVPFTGEEVALLEEITRPVAGAVSNALAYEEIARLTNRLHDENLLLRQELDEQSMFEEIVGSSAPLRKVLREVEKVAPTGSTVLITGETGTGKELIARAIHRRSGRAARAMVKVNLASLPDTLMASELFGHEKGAFTGALQRRVGRFELAGGGTIFLDEVGDVPADVQVALLRVLQEGEFERVGGNQTIRTDARVIAATNRDLQTAIAEGTFRSDLFFRLNVFPICVPPLRDRREDIPILVEYFVARHGRPPPAPFPHGGPADDGRADVVHVAGQHPGARERDRARGDPVGRRDAEPGRSPRACRAGGGEARGPGPRQPVRRAGGSPHRGGADRERRPRVRPDGRRPFASASLPPRSIRRSRSSASTNSASASGQGRHPRACGRRRPRWRAAFHESS